MATVCSIPLAITPRVSFVIDGQPISDQQSKVFSTQLPTSAIQSMEVVTGSPDAEFGDKSSLVAQYHHALRSRLRAGFRQRRRHLRLVRHRRRISGLSATEMRRFGNFLARRRRAQRPLSRYPGVHPLPRHRATIRRIFDRFDYQPNGQDVFHLNLFAARNWIQIPKTYDTLGQDQRQRVLTWSFAPGYQHTFNSHTLLTINPYIRKDQFNYYASRDPFADSPSTQNQPASS